MAELLDAPHKYIKLDPVHINDDSIANQHDPLAGLDGFIVSNSPIASVNGMYLKAGMFDDVPMYRHVRGWVILRDLFPEIPELGITTADVEDSAVGFNKFFNKAEVANEEILGDSTPLNQPTADFARKFIDIARAGNKMITADQTLQNIYNNDRRVVLQAQESDGMLAELTRMQMQFTVSGDTTSTSTLPVLPSIVVPSSSGSSPRPAATKARNPVDLDMVVTKGITYQHTTTSTLPPAMQSQSWSAESELSTEVLACVEKREVILQQLQLALRGLQQVYLEHGLPAAKAQSRQVRDLLQEMRLITLDFAEAYGAWARVVVRQQVYAAKASKASAKILYPVGEDNRAYCVVIAYHSVNELYPVSLPMKSTVKRFTRDYQPAKKAIESKYIGVYPAKQQAIDALEEAYRVVPEEQRLQEDKSAVNKVAIGRRSCGKHYLVRTSGVPSDLPCETCKVAQAGDSNSIDRKIYDSFPVFIWQGANYLDKLWADSALLAGYTWLFPDMAIKSNPFMLDAHLQEELMGGRTRKTADPLNHLKGKRELLQDALTYSKTYQAQALEKERVSKVRNNPYQKNQLDKDLRLLMSASAGNLRGRDQEEKVEQDILGIPKQRYLTALQILSQVQGKLEMKESANEEVGQVGDVAAAVGRHSGGAATAGAMGTNTISVSANTLSATATAHSSQFKSTGEVRTELLTTIFTDQGGQLHLSTTRPVPAFREDDMFCRTDEGEFAGMYQGRSSRQFADQAKQFAVNKAKEHERKHFQNLIRKAISKPFHPDHIEMVKEIIAQAKEVRGSVLQLDIVQAENYLLKYTAMVRYSIWVQAVHRGNHDRNLARRLLAEHVRKMEGNQLTHFYAYDLAMAMVPNLLEMQTSKAKTKRAHAVYRFVVNMSGFLCVISVYRAAREMRKPVQEMCMSCQTNTVLRYHKNDCTPIPTSSSGAGAETGDPIAGRVGMSNNKPVKKKSKPVVDLASIHPNKPAVVRTPCTCTLLLPPESWHVTFYFPLERKTQSKAYSVSEVAKLLTYVEQAKAMQSPNTAKKMLIGESFDVLAPLFGEEKAGTTFAKAWLAAAKEASVLPRLRTKLPEEIAAVIGDGKEQNIDSAFAAVNVPRDLAPRYPNQTHSQYHHVDRNKAEQSPQNNDVYTWQPLHDLESLQLSMKNTGELLTRQQGKLAVIKHNAHEAEVSFADSNAQYEHRQMMLEDHFATLRRLDELIIFETKRNQEILQYEKDLQTYIANLENNTAIDFKQAYDGQESAVRYEEMFRKSQYRKALAAANLLTAGKATDVRVSAREFIASNSKWQSARQALEEQLQIVNGLSTNLSLMQSLQKRRHRDLLSAIHLMMSVYSLPKSFHGRRIAIFPVHLVFMRRPLQRLQKQYRKCLSAIYRQAVTLRKHNSSQYVRCLASFYIDDVTKNFVINIAGTHEQMLISTEESCQYLDFALEKEQFSHILAYSEPSDIIVTSEEVKQILRYNSHYYTGDIFANQAPVRQPDQGLVLPKDKPRDISYLHTIALANDRALTYLQHEQQNNNDLTTAQQLLPHLRLHSDTARVCMGMLHFIRRRALVADVWAACQHFTDKLTQEPLFIDLFYHQITTKKLICFRGSRMEVNVYTFYHQIELHLTMCAINQTFPATHKVLVNMKSVLKSCLEHDEPVIYLCVLKALTCADYNSNMLQDYILSHLHCTLPGQLPFRTPLNSELPVYSIANARLQYKHVFSSSVFVCSKYIYINVYRSVAGDFYFELCKPLDSRFRLHKYTLPMHRLFVSRQEVRLFCLRNGLVELLHPDCIQELISYLVDSIAYIDFNFLAQEVPRTQSGDQKARGLLTIEECPGMVAGEALVIDVASFKSYISHSIEQFALWQQPFIKHLITNLPKLLELMDSYCAPPKYAFRCSDSVSQVQMINVYSTIQGFALADTKHTINKGLCYLHTEVYATADKHHVDIKIANLNMKYHEKEIEDMSLNRDRVQFAEEDVRSRMIITYYTDKDKCMADMQDGQQALQAAGRKYAAYASMMRQVQQKIYQQNLLEYLYTEDRKLVAKNIVTNILAGFFPRQSGRILDMGVRRDVQQLLQIKNNPVFDELQSVFHGLPMNSMLHGFDVLVLQLSSYSSKKRVSAIEHEQAAESQWSSLAGTGNFRNPDLWSRKKKKSMPKQGILHSDDHVRMISVDFSGGRGEYLMRRMTVSDHGIILLRMTNMLSRQDYLVHLLPRQPKDEDEALLETIHNNIQEHVRCPNPLSLQLNLLPVLRTKIAQCMAQSIVTKILHNTCALLLHNNKQPVGDDLEVVQDMSKVLARHTVRESKIDSRLRAAATEGLPAPSALPKPRRISMFAKPSTDKYPVISDAHSTSATSTVGPLPNITTAPVAPPITTPTASRRTSTASPSHGKRKSVVRRISVNKRSKDVVTAIAETVAAVDNVRKVTLKPCFGLFIAADEGIPVQRVVCNNFGQAVCEHLQISSEYLSNPQCIQRIVLRNAIAYFTGDGQKNERFAKLLPDLHGSYGQKCNANVLLLFRKGDSLCQTVYRKCQDMMTLYLPVLAVRRAREGREHEFRVRNHHHFRTIVYGLADVLAVVLDNMFNHCLQSTMRVKSGKVGEFVMHLLRWFDDNPHDALDLIDTSADLMLFDDELAPCDGYTAQTIPDHPYYSHTRDVIMRNHENALLHQEIYQAAGPVPSYYRPSQLVYAMYQQHCYRCQLGYHMCKVPGCVEMRSAARCALGSDSWLVDADQGQAYSGQHELDLQIKSHLQRTLLTAVQRKDHLLDQQLARYNAFYHHSTVHKELLFEEYTDQQLTLQYNYQQSLKMDHRTTKQHLHYLQLINQLLLSPEQTANQVTWRQLLDAQGGLQLAITLSHIENMVMGLKDSKLPFLSIGASNSKIDDSIEKIISKNTNTIRKKENSLLSGKIAVQTISHLISRAVLAADEVDPYPDTSSSSSGNGPMSDVLFALLMKRIFVSKRSQCVDTNQAGRSRAASRSSRATSMIRSRANSTRSRANSNVMSRASSSHMSRVNSNLSRPSSPAEDEEEDEEEEYYTVHSAGRKIIQFAGRDHAEMQSIIKDSDLSFDRLLEEEVLTLPGDALVVVQVLYGCMEQSALLLTEAFGTPSAGLRYISTGQMHILSPGLTIAVYDFHSRVSRAMYMTRKHIQQMLGIVHQPAAHIHRKHHSHRMAANKVDGEDYASISKLILYYAPWILSMQHVGAYCTGVELHIETLKRVFNLEESMKSMIKMATMPVDGHAGNVKRFGKTFVTYNHTASRLQGLRQLLQDNASESAISVSGI